MSESATIKPWYKHWWGVIIAICIWPFFLMWLMWRKGNKTGLVGKLAGSVGIVVLAVIVLIAIASAGKQGASTVASTAPKPVAHKPAVTAKPSSASTASVIAKLNTESIPILNPVLTDFENQMAKGQSYATQPNAADASSAYHQWALNEEDAGNVSNGKEQVTAYNEADNMYYDAHVTAPDAISDWDTDAGNIPGDMSNWADAEYTVLVDQKLNSTTTLSSDQAQAKSDLTSYQTDLAKAQADVHKL